MARSAKGTKIRTPGDIYPVVRSWAKKEQENFLTVTLNGAHEVIRVHHITKGLVDRTIVHPRECFRASIKDNASAVVFVHNHPSGSLYPSDGDKSITKRLCMAGAIMGINVLDHLIISKSGFNSLRASGDMPEILDYEDHSDSKLRQFAAELAAEERELAGRSNITTGPCIRPLKTTEAHKAEGKINE